MKRNNGFGISGVIKLGGWNLVETKNDVFEIKSILMKQIFFSQIGSVHGSLERGNVVQSEEY